MTRVIPISTPSAAYEARVGPGLLRSLGETIAQAVPKARRVVVVVDAGLPGAHVRAACDSLAGFDITTAQVHAAEADKSVEVWARLLALFASHRLERSDAVVALGGGITGDLAGFAAAAYRRGVAVIQCPTTLLAMVDAAVGGKTGVNLRSGPDLLKNMVGAFHHPARVIADVSTLSTLPARVMASGLAECIKHAMIAGAADMAGVPGVCDLGDWLDAHEPAISAQEADALAELVARNIRLKAAVVAGDERETADLGGRALLNLGHTFGHAIETIDGLDLSHGEAVGLGLRCAARYASLARTAREPAAIEHRLEQRLRWAGLPLTVAGLPPAAAIIERMRHDKKSIGGSLRLIVPTSGTTAEVVGHADESLIPAALDAIRA